MSESSAPLVTMSGIDKIFFDKYANRGVDFELERGETHALLGENGAGKTTLMNVLAGIYNPDAGRIYIEGQEARFASPKDAIASGIGMVHQHFMLIPAFTVWENMILGMDSVPFVIDKRNVTAKITELSERYSLPVDPGAKVSTLSIGERQRVELLKMLYREAKVLILDEPTSVLTPRETLDFFSTLRRMTAAGHGIVLISHKIEEVLSIADRMTVLRRGERAATVKSGETRKETLVRMMMGHNPENLRRKRARFGQTVLSCENLSARGDRGAISLRGVSFDLKEGEILGVAGVAGNAQDELCETLAGLRSPDSGKIILRGENVAGMGPREFIERGVSYIPVDRTRTGLVPNMNMRENIALKKYWRKPAARGKFMLDWNFLDDLTRSLAEAYSIQTIPAESPVRALSGGNLQKLMLARELSDKPSVILAMHPVWGLDVGAAGFVRERMMEERGRGAGILFVSDDLDDLFEMSDRIMTIFEGRIMGIADNPSDFSRERIGLLMAGMAV
ncbi:MAG: ABC transporter ATP-binding protein [Synergistaceae bacterium]|nr:ABC transporter ATP-binding protein [Synergistaceae bacterium]